MNKGTITNTDIKVKPSKKLRLYIREELKEISGLPSGLENIIDKQSETSSNIECGDSETLTSDRGRKLTTGQESLTIEEIENDHYLESDTSDKSSDSSKDTNFEYLTLKDLYWLYNYMDTQKEDQQIYFHELLEGSEIILPENETIPRSKELEKRCQIFRNIFANMEYNKITKCVRPGSNISEGGFYPEDSVAHMTKEMNKQIIAIFQFVLSVIAGFAFGFIGLELTIGEIPVGIRLILGVFCALTVASAELYFLIKNIDHNELENYNTLHSKLN